MRRHVLPTAPSPTTTHLRANCHVSEQENAESAEVGGVQKEEEGHCSFIDRPPPCQRVGDDDILGINKSSALKCRHRSVASRRGTSNQDEVEARRR